VMPITLQAHTWFDSPAYRDAVAKTREANHFSVMTEAGKSADGEPTAIRIDRSSL